MWKIEEYEADIDSWETIAVSSTKQKAIEYCNRVKIDEPWRDLYVEEVDFIG